MDQELNINYSIIIPMYNSSRTIIDTLDSVMAQSILAREIIIIDDVSNDNSLELIELYKERHNFPIEFVIIRNAENVGPGGCRNIGLQMAKYEYIAFLDSDDIWDKNKMELCLNEFYFDDELMMVCHAYQSNIKLFKSKVMLNLKKVLIGPFNYFNTPCVVCRKTDSLYFDNRSYGEDAMCWYRYLYCGNKVMFLNLPLSFTSLNRDDTAGLSSDLDRMYRDGELHNIKELLNGNKISYFIYLYCRLLFGFKFLVRKIRRRFRK